MIREREGQRELNTQRTGIVERVAARALIFRLVQDPSGLVVRTKRRPGGEGEPGNSGCPVMRISTRSA